MNPKLNLQELVDNNCEQLAIFNSIVLIERGKKTPHFVDTRYCK